MNVKENIKFIFQQKRFDNIHLKISQIWYQKSELISSEPIKNYETLIDILNVALIDVFFAARATVFEKRNMSENVLVGDVEALLK